MSASTSTVPAYPKGFAAPLPAHGARWTGFYRSVDKKSSCNRYTAMCSYCKLMMDGRPERLKRHVQGCPSWPTTETAQYLTQCTVDQPKARKRAQQHVDSVHTDSEEEYSNTQDHVTNEVSEPFDEEFTEAAAATPCLQQSLLSWASMQPCQSERDESLHQKLFNALIHGNVPLRFAENPFLVEFLHELQPSYRPPSRNMLSYTVMAVSYTRHIVQKQEKMSRESSLTICLDAWSDAAGAAIYGFVASKEDDETVLDIVDLSEYCHRAELIRNETLSVLERSAINVRKSVIACVTGNPAVMVKARRLLQEKHRNMVPIRCSLHAFSTVAKRIIQFPVAAQVVQSNVKLVNYFTSSHIWTQALHEWMQRENITRSLTTFCETRWYSLAKVCLGVATFQRGFFHCAQLSGGGRYPKMRDDIRFLIEARYHFVKNDSLVQVLLPIVDAIAHLESSSATLSDVFEQMITVHQAIAASEVPDITGLRTHALRLLGKAARDFSDDVYFVALFLSPGTKLIAISRMMSGHDMIRACLRLAKNWDFKKRDVEILAKELICYKNQDKPFDIPPAAINPRTFWATFTADAPYLRRFAMMVFAIVPHVAPVEKLFSSLGLPDAKFRNRIPPATLAVLGMIKRDLHKCADDKLKWSPTIGSASVDSIGIEAPVENHCGIDVFNFDEIGRETDEIREHLGEVESAETTLADEEVLQGYFDIDAFNGQGLFESIVMAPTIKQEYSSSEEEWSVDDIIID